MPISMPVLREFDYRPNRLLMVFLFLLCSLGWVLMGYIALGGLNPGGMNICGIKLTEKQTRIVFGVFAVLGAVIGRPLMGALMVSSFTRKRRIALTRDSIIFPKPTRMGLSMEEVELPFRQIRACEVVTWSWPTKALVLHIEPGAVPIPRGMVSTSTVFILSVMFPSREAFDTFAALLVATMNSRHSGP